MADKDRVEGSGKQMGGELKKTVGGITGDEKMKNEGRMDKAEGKVQNAVGGIKDTIRDATDGNKNT